MIFNYLPDDIKELANKQIKESNFDSGFILLCTVNDTCHTLNESFDVRYRYGS